MAMEEELDEFEVLWPEYVTCYTHASYADDHHEPPPPTPTPSSPMPRPGQRWSARSRPVDVPCRGAVLLRCRWKDGGEAEGNFDGDGDGKKNIVVPPHLLVMTSSGTRRPDGETAATSTTTAASLRSGRQRKRARDLRHLRNSVLRMTGFIEG